MDDPVDDLDALSDPEGIAYLLPEGLRLLTLRERKLIGTPQSLQLFINVNPRAASKTWERMTLNDYPEKYMWTYATDAPKTIRISQSTKWPQWDKLCLHQRVIPAR